MDGISHAAFGLQTAVALYGADCALGDVVHVVLCPRRVLQQRAGLTVHARALADEDLVEFDDLRLTSGAQTFLDMAQHLTAPDLLALGDALMRRGVLKPEALTARPARADGVRGVARARR
jgi:hypothetical protein